MNRDAAFHVNAEAELLRQCAASGQLSASQVHAHEREGELPEPSADLPGLPRPWRTDTGFLNAARAVRGQDFIDSALRSPWGQVAADFSAYWELWDSEALRLQREIADDAARVLIETRAMSVPTNYGAPVYLITHLDPFECGPEELQPDLLADVQRAVRYLELRGLLKRPLPSQPDCVTFGGV